MPLPKAASSDYGTRGPSEPSLNFEEKQTKSPFILLAPMEGVIDPVLRQMIAHFSEVDCLVTEFIRVTDKLLPDHVFYKIYPELRTGSHIGSRPVIPQLLGGQANPMADNALRLKQMGAPAIDLNFGCPAKTVNRHDGGASLLQKPERIYEIISTIRKALGPDTPVSAKVRLGYLDKSLHKEIAIAASEAQARWLTVHARTKAEGYQPPAHWEFIASMKEVIQIPLIANGDIWSVEDYQRCLSITGCRHVALGRGLLARPTLAKEIKILSGSKHPVANCSWEFIEANWLPAFLKASKDYKNESYAVTRGKQLIKILGREFPEAKELFERAKIHHAYPVFYQEVCKQSPDQSRSNELTRGQELQNL